MSHLLSLAALDVDEVDEFPPITEQLIVFFVHLLQRGLDISSVSLSKATNLLRL